VFDFENDREILENYYTEKDFIRVLNVDEEKNEIIQVLG
jgi:hypothetical protein